MTVYKFILILVGVFFGAFGAIFLKKGSLLINSNSSYQFIFDLWRNYYLMLGLFFYVVPSVIWIYLLRTLPVSQLQPILSLTYVITPLLAICFLGEPVSVTRWVGIFVIVAGVIIVAVTS